uniref:Uncharacterized protein n=1 Tax=Amphimedon queenslandica TaxID=400682 RepID=A0A1X7SM72_AMPQE
MAALNWITTSKDSFKSCLQACSAAKFECSKFFSYKPREFSFRSKGKEVIFLAPVENIGNNVFSVSADDDTLTRKKLCSPEGRHALTRSEQLLRERMRASGSGITDYKYIQDIDSILVNTGTACSLFSCQDDKQ